MLSEEVVAMLERSDSDAADEPSYVAPPEWKQLIRNQLSSASAVPGMAGPTPLSASSASSSASSTAATAPTSAGDLTAGASTPAIGLSLLATFQNIIRNKIKSPFSKDDFEQLFFHAQELMKAPQLGGSAALVLSEVTADCASSPET